MKSGFCLICANLFVLVSASVCLGQGRLIAVDSSRALSEIDVLRAFKFSIGVVSMEAGTTGGLALQPSTGTVFVTSTGNDSLYTLDLSTGTATLVGAYGITSSIVMHGLEFTSSGVLYASSSHNGGLYEIDPSTGAATFVGLTTGSSFTNLVWDSHTGTMYTTHSGDDSFRVLDLTLGIATSLGFLTHSTNPQGLAYHERRRKVYLVDNTTDQLYIVNTSSGLATSVGSTGSGNLLGLVYVPVACSYTDVVVNGQVDAVDLSSSLAQYPSPLAGIVVDAYGRVCAGP